MVHIMLLCFSGTLSTRKNKAKRLWKGHLGKKGWVSPSCHEGSLTVRKELTLPHVFKQRHVSVAFLLLLLEEFVAGAGAGQEKPEALGDRERASDSSFPSRSFQGPPKEGGRHPLQSPTQTFSPSLLSRVGTKHMNSSTWPVISQSEKSSTGAWTCWAQRKSRRALLMVRLSSLKGRWKEQPLSRHGPGWPPTIRASGYLQAPDCSSHWAQGAGPQGTRFLLRIPRSGQLGTEPSDSRPRLNPGTRVRLMVTKKSSQSHVLWE